MSRPEKQYYKEEVTRHLDKSDYVILVSFNRLTVSDVTELRLKLDQQSAEYHVVKNNILKVAAQERLMPDFTEVLSGHTAIVVGGRNPAEVAKILLGFQKEKEEKCKIKLGIISNKKINAKEVEMLSKLPSLQVLQSQLLRVLKTPASNFVRLLNAAPQSLLNVLQAKVNQ